MQVEKLSLRVGLLPLGFQTIRSPQGHPQQTHTATPPAPWPGASRTFWEKRERQTGCSTDPKTSSPFTDGETGVSDSKATELELETQP